jgi:hypothetical protein
VTFPQFNADNTVSSLDAASFRTAIGAGSGGGSVTSVALSAPAFLSVSGSPITTSGTLALSYSGTALPIANGGTGNTTIPATSIFVANSANTLTTVTPTASQSIRINSGGTAWEAYTPSASTGTVSSVGWTGGIVSIADATTTPAFTIAGTSGGIPYFSSGTTWATSAALAANALVIGGGAGVAPSTTTTGTGVLTALASAANAAAGFVTGNGTATLTNKTISADSNTLSGIAASSFVLSNASGNIDGSAAAKAIPSGVVVGTTDTQTLTNKTLTSPVIGTIVNTGTLTLPTSTDTLVGRATTDTLTNKTISADSNTLSGIAASSFVLSNASGNIDGAAAQKAIPTGVVVGNSDTQTLTNKRIDPRDVSAASASTLTPDVSAGDIYAYTALAAALTINAPIGTPTNGDKLIFRLLDNGTARALTWNATYVVIGVTLPTTTIANKTTYVGCIYNANNTRWDVIAVTTQA